MDSQFGIFDFVLALLFFLLTINEIYKSIMILFMNKQPLLLAMQISLWIMRVFPFIGKTRYQKAKEVYASRIKLYGVLTFIGGTIFVLVLFNVMSAFFEQ